MAGDVLVLGTLAATESGNDTASLTGAVPIQGTVAAPEGADTAALTGTVLVQGSFAATENADVAAMAGEGALPNIVGSFAATEASDSASISGVVPITGTLEANETGDSASFASIEISELPSTGGGPKFGEPAKRQQGEAEGANLRIVLLLNPGTALGIEAAVPAPVETGLSLQANRAFARRAYAYRPGKAFGAWSLTEEEEWLLLLAA
jgi:hypothetical protein